MASNRTSILYIQSCYHQLFSHSVAAPYLIFLPLEGVCQIVCLLCCCVVGVFHALTSLEANFVFLFPTFLVLLA